LLPDRLYSHFAQHPRSARAAGATRGPVPIHAGSHVVTGIASDPLLLAKLWSVYPRLFQWPPFTSAAQAIERLAIFPLVAGAIFMLFTGLANINLCTRGTSTSPPRTTERRGS